MVGLGLQNAHNKKLEEEGQEHTKLKQCYIGCKCKDKSALGFGTYIQDVAKKPPKDGNKCLNGPSYIHTCWYLNMVANPPSESGVMNISQHSCRGKCQTPLSMIVNRPKALQKASKLSKANLHV